MRLKKNIKKLSRAQRKRRRYRANRKMQRALMMTVDLILNDTRTLGGHLEYKVHSPSQRSYLVYFTRSGSSMGCNCQAGGNCAHELAVKLKRERGRNGSEESSSKVPRVRLYTQQSMY